VTDEIKRTLRVAAVQVISKNGMITENLKHATGFIEEAAARGAKLILLPEFMPTGYIFSKEIWNGGEAKEGLTVKWIKEISKRLGVWLGTSFLEAEGEDFYNTFILANPEGKEDGRVRKQKHAAGETYFVKGETGPHIINTRLGKIGVGICYETQWAFLLKDMYLQSVDLMLQPHCAPRLTVNKITSEKTVEVLKVALEKRPLIYADMLGVPVIFSNHSGKWSSPMPGMPFLKQDTHFDGLSAIVDSNGTLKARLGSEEGIIVEDVILDPAVKKKESPVTYGRWAIPAHGTWPKLFIEAIGSIWYQFNRDRKLRAREISLMR